MQIRTKQGLQTLRRAHAFLAARELSAALGGLKPHVEALDAIVVRLEQFATEQEARTNAARAATDAKREQARALRREYLRPIAQVARRLFADDSELRSAFRVPEARDDEGLIQACNGFAAGVEQHKAKFAARGLAVDAVDRLRKATDAFRDSLVGRSLDLARRSAATAGLLAELSRGRDLVRLLDLMLAPRLTYQPDQLAEWRTIARFLRGATLNVEDVPGAGDGSGSAAGAGSSGSTGTGGSSPTAVESGTAT